MENHPHRATLEEIKALHKDLNGTLVHAFSASVPGAELDEIVLTAITSRMLDHAESSKAANSTLRGHYQKYLALSLAIKWGLEKSVKSILGRCSRSDLEPAWRRGKRKGQPFK